MKAFLFRFYWLAIFLALGAIVALRLNAESSAAVIAISLSFVYFAHTQKLEEIRLFKDLFTEFNGRYDKLNGPLARILHGRNEDDLATDEVNTLYDYFNLCAEEFFYYKHGYIHAEVWNAWSNGMQVFFANPRIKQLWREEARTESYYGFRP